MKEIIFIREATEQDLDALKQLLEQVDLLTHDILARGTHFWVAEDSRERMVGCAGMEFGKKSVLLRNVAVLPVYRKQGIGLRLVEQGLRHAACQGFEYVYLFSMRSGGYWQRMGFQSVTTGELLEALPDAYQVNRFQKMGKLDREHAWRKKLLEYSNLPQSEESE